MAVPLESTLSLYLNPETNILQAFYLTTVCTITYFFFHAWALNLREKALSTTYSVDQQHICISLDSKFKKTVYPGNLYFSLSQLMLIVQRKKEKLKILKLV